MTLPESKLRRLLRRLRAQDLVRTWLHPRFTRCSTWCIIRCTSPLPWAFTPPWSNSCGQQVPPVPSLSAHACGCKPILVCMVSGYEVSQLALLPTYLKRRSDGGSSRHHGHSALPSPAFDTLL